MNSTIDISVIKILIICATIIALTAIICDYFAERKTSDSSERWLSKRIIKVHRNYITGFLGFAVIMLITANYGGPGNDIFAYISFGSTITSLVLSILAIFVTVRSSMDSYKQFTKIDSANASIQTVSHQINGSLETLSDVGKGLKDVSNSIEEKINDIVNKVDERLRVRMKETEDNISNRIVKQNIISNDTYINEDITNKTDAEKKSYLTRLPYTGVLIIYACTKAFEEKKRLDLKIFFKNNEWYSVGLIMSSIAAGFIKAGVSGDPEDEDVVDCIDSVYSSQEIINVMRQSSSRYNAEFDDDIRRIDHLFNEVKNIY